MVFFIQSILAQLFLNFYFIFRLGKNTHIRKLYKYLTYSLIVFELLVYFTGFFFREYLRLEHFAYIQTVNCFWVVFSLYFLIFLSVFDLFRYLNRKRIFHIQLNNKVVSIIGTIAFIAFFVYIGFHFHSSNDRYLEPQKRNFSIELNTACNDNIQNGESYKLLVVSDLHLGYIINKEALKKYVSVINAQNADIIVIAGDLIDFYLEPLEIQKMDEDLKCLYAPHGVYFIPGNHEYKIDAEIDLEWIRKTGITVLRDSVANIGSKLQLIGRDDRKNKENRMAWNDLMIQTDSSKAQILIAHNPKDINEVADIPLVICGHSHNGQVFPINFLCRILYPNSYGFKRKGNVCTYTTSGIGLSGFPLRICSESELVIFNVEIK